MSEACVSPCVLSCRGVIESIESMRKGQIAEGSIIRREGVVDERLTSKGDLSTPLEKQLIDEAVTDLMESIQLSG